MSARRSTAKRAARLAVTATAAMAATVTVGAVTTGAATAAPARAHSAQSRTSAEVKISNALLSMLNGERKAHDLPPLTMDSHLLVSARRHDLAMAHANDMSHQVDGEPDLGHRVSAAGYNWSWAGENIGWNSDMSQQGVLQLEQLMYDEKPPENGHRLNILSSHYRNVGVDVYFDNAHKKVWLTTDFGRPMSTSHR